MTDFPDKLPKPGRFGWGSFTPNFLQRFHTVKFLAVLMVLSNCCTFLEKGYLISIAETLQTVFNFSNVQIGVLVGLEMTFVLILALPIAHLARKGHKGRWIGTAAVLSIVSGFGFVLPKFLPKSAPLGNGNILDDEEDSLAGHLNNYSFASELSSPSDVRHASSSNAAFAIFVTVQLLSSFIGAINTLMLSYIERNAKQSDVALYSTLITGFPNLFFAGGFLMTPVIQSLHSLDSENTLIDNWWKGFLISPSIHIFLVLPLFGFAPQLPEYASNRVGDVDQCHRKRAESVNDPSGAVDDNDDVINDPMFWSKICNLFRNPVFMLITLRGALSTMVITGSTAFFMVYLQHAFGFSKSPAALITAFCWVLSYVVGNVIGSVVVKAYGLLVKQIIHLCLYTMIISTLMLLILLLNCNQSKFTETQNNFLEDYNLCQENQLKAYYSIKTTRHSHKMCLNDFNVTIAIDLSCTKNLTTEQLIHDNLAVSCGCLNVLSKHFGGAKSTDLLKYPKFSPGNCFLDYVNCKWKRIIFALIITLSSLIGGMGAIPAWQAILLVVPSNERTIVVALVSTFHGIHDIAGPIIVGIGFDSFCLAHTKSDNRSKLCNHYNTFGLSLFLCLLFLITGIVGIVMLAIAAKVYKPVQNPVMANLSDSTHKVTNESQVDETKV